MLCWRAWYAVDEGYQFAKPHVHNVSPQHRKAWFAVGKSKILRQWFVEPRRPLARQECRATSVELPIGAR